jgi:hypothetical protein
VRLVRLELDYGGGDGVDALLLRDLGWLRDRAVVEGGVAYLDLPEMGAVGWARVESVGPCPELERGPGRLVTGWFRHWRGEVWELSVEGEAGPIGVTAGHPFWSEDRQGWVAAGELGAGERLLARDGSAPRVESLALRPGHEPVYNIEVEGDHCYRVGRQGLLVHNASVKPAWIKPDTYAYMTYAQPAAQYRSKNSYPGLDQGIKTLAVLVYMDDMNAKHRLPATGYGISGGGNGHAEAKLLIDFKKIKSNASDNSCYQIVEIFVERTPCDDKPGTANKGPQTGCDTKINDAAKGQSQDIAVFYLAAASTDNASDALLAGYRLIGLYNHKTGRWYGQDGFDAS